MGVRGLRLLSPLCCVWWFVSVGHVVLGRALPADPSSLGLRWRRRLWGCGGPSAGAHRRVFQGMGIRRRGLHHLLAAVASVGVRICGRYVYGGLWRGFYGVLTGKACLSSFSAFSSSSLHLMRPPRVSTCFATSVVSLIISVVASSRLVYLELAMSGSGPWYW